MHLPLRKMAASLQTVRSIALVKSVFSTAPVFLAIATSYSSAAARAACQPLLLFSTDNTLLKGSPV
jgi:hypothetical protein